jgi:DNA-binding transcriptional ArsR family regulator|tara:strand:+ start:270 stop:599 length:330 start_codon:yes stop_codon:yes gene_type:complete
MGVTKTEEFTQEQNALAVLAKVLGHPARIAILQYLISSKSCITGNLVELLPLSQSTISQHLKELKSVGLIKGTIEGTSVCYCINVEMWEQANNMLNQLFEHYRIENKCC